MEDNTENSVQNIVSQVLESSSFKTLVAEAITNFNSRHSSDLNCSNVQSTTSLLLPSPLPTGSTRHSSTPSQLPSGSTGHNSSPTLIQNLKSLFPSTRGKLPSFSKQKRNRNLSTTTVFYRDIILLTNPKAICTLKGSRKSDAYDSGLAVSDFRFDCMWNRQQIFEHLNELFPKYLTKDIMFEILVPESGKLIKIDESREPLDGYKLKRLYQNRKAVYLRPFSNLHSVQESLSTSDYEDSLLLTNLNKFEDTSSPHIIDDGQSRYKMKNEKNMNIIDDEENELADHEENFQRDLGLAIERSLIESEASEVCEVTIESLLTKLKTQIKDDSTTYFNVYRKEVFESCKRAVTRKKFDPFAKVSVTFTDILKNSEGAVDEGGPRREMFRLLLKELESGLLFEGNEKKFITLNSKCLENNDYFDAGRLISLSILHVGQGPTFFSDILFSTIANGINGTKATDEFIDKDTLSRIYQIRQINELDKLQDIIVNESVFTIAGINFIFNIEEKEEIIERTIKFYCFYRIKGAIDQFIEGLKTGGIYDLIVKYPGLFYPLMCSDSPLTSNIVLNLFQVFYSDDGSNYRELENKIIGFWRDYVLDCGEVENVDEEVTLEDILIFATGSRNVPPLGFDVQPSIKFLHATDEHSIKHFPEANTCTLTLHLPVKHKIYANFKADLDYGIKNSKVFGRA